MFRFNGKHLAVLVTASMSFMSGLDASETFKDLSTLEQMLKSASGKGHMRSGAHGARDPHAELTPDKHAQVALQHLQEGRMQQAMQTLDQALRQYPEAAELYGIRGSLRLQQDNVSAALKDLEAAVRLAPDNPEYLTNRAQAYRKFRRVKEAMADLDRAIELNGDLLSARFNRGAMAFGAGRFEAALTDFEHCIAVDPHMAAPYFNRAAVYDALGKREQAIADIERFIQIAPSEQWKQAANDLLKKWQEEKEQNASAKET